MITSREIVRQMILEELTNKTVYHTIREYYPVSKIDIQTIIDKGVKNNEKLEVLLRYALRLIKKLPENYEKIDVKNNRKAIAVDITHKQDALTRLKGIDHHNFKQEVSHIVLAKKAIKNKLFIGDLIDKLGGKIEVADRLGCLPKTIENFQMKRENYIYVQPKYVNLLIYMAEEKGIKLTPFDFLQMMPDNKQNIYLKNNPNAIFQS